MQAISVVHVRPQTSAEKSIPANELDAQLKFARQRNVYVQLRMPRLRAEIKALAEERKKAVAEPANGNEEPVARRKIYIHEHLLSLRKMLRALEEERISVSEFLKNARDQSAAKGT